MGCIINREGKDAHAHSKQIDRELKNESNRLRRQFKLLLLGAGESGKSTIVKQCKIIHSNGYDEDERKAYRSVVFDNILNSCAATINGMRILGIDFKDPCRKNDAASILSADKDSHSWLSNPSGILATVQRLYKDPGFRYALIRSNEFTLNDSAEYFFEALGRISQGDYLPTEQDVLRTRVLTTGISESKFIDRNFEIIICDVGGQRSERRKWMHCFENITAIIFVVALSEYDLKLREDDEMNRMLESLKLFQSICHNALFANTDIILFLNKEDLFAEKIKHSSLTVCFPDYQGTNDIEPAREFILQKFLGMVENEERQIYHHFTCATDTSTLKFVLSSVTDVIIKKNLKQIGLV